MYRDRRIARGGLKAALLGGAAATLLATAAMAQERPISFDIAAQDAGSALNDFSRQSGLRVLFPYDAVEGKNAPAVRGDMTADEALDTLLRATGLVVAANDGTTVTLTDPQSGSAAGDGADSGTVEALIVTAQKREEDIQDVPIAISAFTQEDLTRQQIAGGPDLITQVPNMTFTKTNFSSYSVQLRGIGTQAISATTDPAVAVAFNNTPFIRNRFFEQEFYDLQRVEVLRGPQGTLYGRNATAGVVNIISQKPKFTAEAKLSGDISNFNSTRLEGMVNIPLVEDKVAVRLAGAWTKRDGYATNELTGNPIDGRDLWSTRLSLRFAPTDAIDVNLIWEHFEEDDDRLRSGKQLCKKHELTNVGGIPVEHGTLWVNQGNDGQRSGVQGQLSQGCERESLYSPDSFQTPNGSMIAYYTSLSAIGLPTQLDDPYVSRVQTPDWRVIESAVDPEYRARTDLGELQISVDLTDTLTLSSETAYSVDWVFSKQDFNRFNTAPGAWRQPLPGDRPGVLLPGPDGGIFCDPQLGCSDRLVAVDVATAEARQFSQEFRLASDFEGPFNFSLGANWLRADSYDKYYVFLNSVSLIAALGPVFNDYPAYTGGVTDNSHCLVYGLQQGNPNGNLTLDGIYPVQGCTYIDPNPIGSLNDQGHNYFLSNNPYKLISYAVFGEAYYNLTENLKFTAGLRWTVDKKEAPRIPTWILATQSYGYPVAEVIEQEWREPTGRVAVDWKPDLGFTDETLLYASYAHGYKAGGANPPGFVRVYYADITAAQQQISDSATRPKVFQPEFVDAFELGSKNTLADGRVTLNLAAFYYDYKDYQISEIVDRSAFNRNFDATVWGLELEGDWRPADNFKLGVKVGYEKTRIADGEKAVDLMDRTAGDPNWTILRPFPTFASSCILPAEMFARAGGVYKVGNIGGGGPGGCEIAYQFGLDPVTEQPYNPNTFITNQGFSVDQPYRGFNPATAPNHGEGIDKPLGGNELPNAPDLTATITADYTIPLPNDWLATLHTDLHWQSESWWRVFNDHEFDRLDEYFTMNLAAIFTNEEAGWNVMAYIKNVTDETAITGAFLNSDDTGLTTNIFLTEPRLYGMRVTKNFTGMSLGSFGERHEGPYPFTLELGGQILRQDAPSHALQPSFTDAFGPEINNFAAAQDDDFDWGDGREVKLSWRPSDTWIVSAALRYGRANSGLTHLRNEHNTDEACVFGGDYAGFCSPDAPSFYYQSRINFSDAEVTKREEHTLVDFMVGREFGLGGLSASTLSAGLRYAQFESRTRMKTDGIPDWVFPDGFYIPGFDVTHTRYRSLQAADREFNGVGPVVSWDASKALFGDPDAGHVDLDWSVSGGVLFGKQKTTIAGSGNYGFYEQNMAEDGLFVVVYPSYSWTPPDDEGPTTEVNASRSESVTTPTAAFSLGLSYNVDRLKVGAGYRWERYFDVLDVGQAAASSGDRTVDGPYFKLSVGFGG